MGIPLAYVQELAGYWEKSYDMRRVADRLNRYEQFTTTIDGVGIHFLHVRSPVEGATPCVMTHGWPGSVVVFVKVIDPLVDPVSFGGEASDALELVIPSLPGHGWSGKPAVTGWNVEKIAQAWIELMDRLGYERWVAQGGDWGALVSSAIGRLADPAKLVGIHVNWALADPAKLMELGGPSEEEQRYLARLQHSSEAEGGYAIEQATKPQTVGYGLTDSPAGQLAWIVEKFKTWSDSAHALADPVPGDRRGAHRPWGRAGQRRGPAPGHPAPAVHPAARNRIQRLHVRGPAGRVALARVDRVHAARPAAPVPLRPMPGTGRASNASVGHLQASRLAAAPANSHRQTGRNDAGRRYTRTCSYPPHSPWVSQ
jgi:pimeloyl-ACP methyl ester carboxylesterase